MSRLTYLVIFVVSVLVLGLGTLFLCAAISLPERWPLALVLLAVGGIGAGWSAYAYRKWANIQPATLAARITDLAAENEGEISLAQAMSALDVPASVATAAFEELEQKGQCRREPRGGQMLYVFPGLKERKVVRKCVYCGSIFPVKQVLQKCPNCGGTLELVKQ